MNPLLKKDFYKVDHRSQYPKGITKVYSNLTARSSRIKGINWVVFFGLQMWLKKLNTQWKEKFFSLSETDAVTKYKRILDGSLGKDAVSVEHIKALHKLGYLPLEIRALKEGSVVPLRVPMLTIENTHPEFFWLTNFLETTMSANLWHTITSATTAKRYRDILLTAAVSTGGDPSFVEWQGHDFSYRGMCGDEAAAMSGAAHLLSFTGTDTIPAIECLEEYYGANVEKELIGGSVYATEHSVMCAGSQESEFETYKRLITEVYPKGIVSIVSDTWDLWNVVTEYLPKLKETIMARDGKVVIRPDSGNPVTILAGRMIVRSGSRFIYDQHPSTWENYCWVEKDKYYGIRQVESKEGKTHNLVYQVSETEVKGLIELLWDIFGGTENEKGFKVLDPHIGAIYGDSITPERAYLITARLAQKKFASTNVVLGVASYTYQYVTRDVYGMAIKATYCEINGEPRELFKDPKTDNGTKRSAKGLLAVYKNENDGAYYLKDQATREEANNCELELVYKDGKLLREQTLSDIRKILRSHDPVFELKAKEEVTQEG